MSRWEPIIGLEIHVQLLTASKAFSAAPAGFGSGPNQQTDPVVLGLPGALPVFNQKALEHAIRLGLAAGCDIRRRCRFARKHYFYPDLPKGYQISQYDEPICDGGALAYYRGDELVKVDLIRIHLEEDAGKSTHQPSGDSLIDLNRAGVPLCEVVTQPVLTSAKDAAATMRALHTLIRYLDISSGDMEKGHLRCDANVSLRPAGTSALGTRTELKNINSFRFVEQAIEHEIARQTRILDGGGAIVQETRLWDADAGNSHTMRTKEEAEDYRYLPDPDLPPLVVTDELLARMQKSLPALPTAEVLRLRGLGLPGAQAAQLAADKSQVDYFDRALAVAGNPVEVADWMLNVQPEGVAPEALGELIGFVQTGTINRNVAKTVLQRMAGGESAKAIIEREGLAQVSDDGALREVAAAIVAANPGQVAQYRAGKEKLFGFFVGQVMKETKGRANPALVNQILEELLKA